MAARVARRARRLPLALAAGLLAAGAAGAQPLVIATSQVCTGTGAGDCETAPSVIGPGQTASLSRSWDAPPGFAFLASTSLSIDYVSFTGFARASGYDTPASGTEFAYAITRIARSLGSFSDVLTAGSGGGSGYFRIPLHLLGSTAISWQNGAGSAELGLSCVSSAPGSPIAIGHCPPVALSFLADETLDTVVALDVPIVLGEPFEYRVSLSLAARTGHGVGDAIPFTGASEASFSTGPFAGATVLDADKQPIPAAPISASASGFVYAPEPAPGAGGAAALLVLAARARQRRR